MVCSSGWLLGFRSSKNKTCWKFQLLLYLRTKKDGDSTDLVARMTTAHALLFLLYNIITAGGTGKSSEHPPLLWYTISTMQFEYAKVAFHFIQSFYLMVQQRSKGQSFTIGLRNILVPTWTSITRTPSQGILLRFDPGATILLGYLWTLQWPHRQLSNYHLDLGATP